ncbi:MAG: protein-L-isoaspartate O-methyltransferase [Candidatus Pacearchaeota archaeon]
MSSKSQLISSLKQKGFSKKILNAFSKVPRERFIPLQLRSHAYEDIALSIGNSQTISQPYTIAEMLSLLKLQKEQIVLEVGSGCGYVLALLSEIVGEKGKIYGIEIIKELAENSKQNLKDYKNVEVYNKNGTEGLEKFSPFTKILISAASKKVPEKLLEQLKDKGILVAPIGNQYSQTLTSFQKINNKLKIKKQLPGFIFVKFVD